MWLWILIWAAVVTWWKKESCTSSDEINWTKLVVCSKVWESLATSYKIYFENKDWKVYKLDDFYVKWPFQRIVTKNQINKCLQDNNQELLETKLDSVFLDEVEWIKSQVSECL